VRALAQLVNANGSQHKALEKYAKKRKDRSDLIDATHNAFLFTLVASEPRAEPALAKYKILPNPAFTAALRPYELRRQNAERSPTLFNVAWACSGEKGRHLGERRSPYQALARRRPCWSEKTAPRRSFQMRHQRATCSSDRKSSMVFQVKTMFSYQRDAGTAK